MKIKPIQAHLMACILVVTLHPLQALAQQSSDTEKANGQPATALRDGQRDFDFEVGTWKIHLKRLVHPLTGSNTWVDFDGRPSKSTQVLEPVKGCTRRLDESSTYQPRMEMAFPSRNAAAG